MQASEHQVEQTSISNWQNKRIFGQCDAAPTETLT